MGSGHRITQQVSRNVTERRDNSVTGRRIMRTVKSVDGMSLCNGKERTRDVPIQLLG